MFVSILPAFLADKDTVIYFLCALKEKDKLKLFSEVIDTTLTMLWIQLNLERSFELLKITGAMKNPGSLL